MLRIVANLLEYKAAEELRSADESIRDKIHELYSLVHESNRLKFLIEIATNKGVSGEMPHQVMAQYGHLFLKKVLILIDSLYGHHDHASLSEILRALADIVVLIKDNQTMTFNGDGSPNEDESNPNAQFTHVNQFAGLIRGGNQAERKEMFQKVTKGLHLIHDKCVSIISDIKELSDKDPSILDNDSDLINVDELSGTHFSNQPTRAVANRKLMEKFVYVWGPQKFNMSPTLEDISSILRDPDYTSKLTQFLNSLNRGGDGGEHKSYILDKLITTMGPQKGYMQ